MDRVNLRSAAVLTINNYSNLKKKFITDLANDILDSFSSFEDPRDPTPAPQCIGIALALSQ